MHEPNRLHEQLFRYRKAYQLFSKRPINTKSRKPRAQISKIHKAVKNFFKRAATETGKTLASAVITTVIVKATGLIEVANAKRPQFAVGGEWLLIIFMFVGIRILIERATKNKKATQQK